LFPRNFSGIFQKLDVLFLALSQGSNVVLGVLGCSLLCRGPKLWESISSLGSAPKEADSILELPESEPKELDETTPP